MDDFLLGCDVLEIAILTSSIAPPDQTEFWKPFRIILGNEEDRPRFEEYYPAKLPQLLALRLDSRFNSVEEDNDNSLSSFMLQFLALDRGFMETLNGRYLLRLLDSFKIQGYRFDDISNLISQQELFVERVLIPPKSRKVVAKPLVKAAAQRRWRRSRLNCKFAIDPASPNHLTCEARP
jgi:hypothetical protein